MGRTGRGASTFAALLIVAGCDQVSQPKSYDDCILKHMGGVASDHAATLIRESCRKKFPDAKAENNEIELTDAELSKLTGRFEFFGSQYGGSIYNGNDDITVTSITIEVTVSRGEQATSREYRQRVKVPPLSTTGLAVNVLDGMEGVEHSGNIASARGYRK